MMKKKNDGYKKIKSLFYIVAIISMIIAIFGKVSAEEIELQPYDDSFYDYLNEKFHCSDLKSVFEQNNIFPDSSWNYVESYINNNNFIAFLYNDNRLDISNMQYSAGSARYVTWESSGNRVCMTSASNIDNTSLECYLLGFTYGSGSNSMKLYKINFGSRQALNGSNPYSYYVVTRTQLYSNNWQSYLNDQFIGTYDITLTRYYNYVPSYGYANTTSGWWVGISSYQSSFTHIELEHITYDDNFIIYKSYGVGGISDPLLNIQYADNIFSQGYTYTSSTTYNLTFDVDGTETTVSISSSVYPDDFFENGSFRTSFDLIYRMLSNKIINFSSAATVTLTAVSMSATAYPTSDQQGTPESVTKSTLCSLVLKGSEGSTNIESEVIPDITDVTIVYDQVVGSDDFHNHTGSYNLNQPVPSWADMYTIVIDTAGTTSHGKPWSTVDLYFDYRDFLWFGFYGYTDPNFTLSSGPDTYINYDYLKQYIENPAMFMQFLGLINSCDVVRIVEGWWNNDGWETQTDYVFYLQNYYNKLSIKGLGNIQSAVESGTYYTKSLYWYVKQRLDNMSDNIAEYEEKALSNQVVGNGYLQSINTNIISIKDSIDTGVKSIVSAISGISGGSSYSLPSLSMELQRLFIPSLTWQSIDFDEYMDSIGVLSLPFTFTNDVLDIADNSYSSTLDLHINDFSLDVTGNNDVLTIFEDQDYTFNPRSIFANDVWTMLTYLNAFALILGEAWITYCHIFRRGMQNDC